MILKALVRPTDQLMVAPYFRSQKSVPRYW